MKLLVDMNLAPDWVPFLEAYGWEAEHWSQIGNPNVPDTDLFQWARENKSIILTQDLDFSQILYATREDGPSVVLLRMDNEFDPAARAHIGAALAQAQSALQTGALLTVSGKRVRLRHLPICP